MNTECIPTQTPCPTSGRPWCWRAEVRCRLPTSTGASSRPSVDGRPGDESTIVLGLGGATLEQIALGGRLSRPRRRRAEHLRSALDRRRLTHQGPVPLAKVEWCLGDRAFQPRLVVAWCKDHD